MVHASQTAAHLSQGSRKSYAVSTCVYPLGLPDREYIQRRVQVPVHLGAAIARHPFLAERHVVELPALRTHFGGREEPVYFDHRLASHGGLGFQPSDVAADGGIGNAAGNGVVFDHAAQAQVLHVNNIKLVEQPPRKLFLVIVAAVGNLLPNARHAKPRLLAPLGAFLFSGERLLRLGELALVFRHVAGIGYRFARGQRGKPAQAKINSDFLAGFRQVFRRNIDNQGNEVAPAGLADYGNGGWLHRHMARPLDLELSELGHKKALVPNLKAKAGARIFGALLPNLFAEGGIARAPLKEVLEGALKVPQRLLDGNAGDFFEPRKIRLALKLRQCRAGLRVIHLFLSRVSRRAFGEKIVVNEAATAKRPAQDSFLRRSRVETEYPPLLHALHLAPLSCKSQQQIKRQPRKERGFIPRLKARVSAARS